MPDRSFDVLTIGNAIVDVQTFADDDFLDRHGLIKGSMQLIDGAEAERLYDLMGPGTETSGGSAANTAVGVASLGGRAAFVGKVRDDQLGEVYLHDLHGIGVAFPVPAAPADDPDSTGRCLILVTPDGERTMNTNLGIAARVTVDDIDEALVAGASIVYAEGYLWDSPPAKEAIRRTIELARAAQTQVAFTLSDGFCVDRHRADFLELVHGGVDILFANESEICSLHETTDFEAAIAATNMSVPLSFVTRSEKGSVVVAGDEIHQVEATAVAQVVDTTGAGDLYAAGALYGLTSGADLPTCARLGSLAAGEVISHLGARPLADLQELATEAGLLGG